MFTRFRSNLRQRVAKVANIAALLSLLSSLFTFAPTPVLAAEALTTLTTTLAQPIFSTNFLTDPSYTNVTYSWSGPTAFEASGSDPCLSTGECVLITIDLQDTGTTTTYQGQEWMSTVTTTDFIWSGPTNSSVTTATRSDVDSNGRYERLQVSIGCSAACVFATSTAYSFSIVNYPIKNPQEPAVYTPGEYSSLTQAFDIDDITAPNQQSASKTSVVAVGKGLTVTASVDPSLTFSVTGLATSTAFYTDSSSVSTVANPDACSFGTLTPAVAKVCLFDLNISTNASNGYAIYVVQDQNMTFNGNAIKQFKDGARVGYSTSTYWTSPSSTQLAHLGYSSDDTSVFAATSTALWAGVPNIASSAQAADTSVANAGLVADSSAPNTASYVYALKVESASTLPQATGYTHTQYFLVVGNF